jgi:acyl-CoA dehydrogenase
MLPFCDERRDALRARARAFAAALPRRAGEGDEVRAAALALGGEGLLAAIVPGAYGGLAPAIEALSLAVIREELAYASPLHDSVFAVQGLAAHVIARGASGGLAARMLPAIARGELVAAFALTEPEAGSDVGALATRAVADASGFVLDGTKTFISCACAADELVVFARAGEPDGGVAAFVVPRASEGVTVTRIELLGAHDVASVRLRGVRVEAERRLEGDGLALALGTLEVFRPTVGAAACGLARRALDEALRRTRARRQFGRPLSDQQTVAFALAEMATELEAARGLVYRAAWERERAGLARRPLEASMAKLFATEAAQRIVDRSVQLHGAAGLVRGAVLERLYREVRALRIYEGTSEIQKLVIARELIG